MLATNSGEKTVVASCVFCEKAGHSLLKCYKFMDQKVSGRVNFIQEKKLSFGYFQSVHHLKECQRRQTCNICEKGHPTKNEPVQLKLSIMPSRNITVPCQTITGLQLRRFYSHKVIPLPATYTRYFTPANREHIPTPETAKVWPQLEHIAAEIVHLNSCAVGLLIGYNCPEALVPSQVVPSKGNQPFGLRTDLG